MGGSQSRDVEDKTLDANEDAQLKQRFKLSLLSSQVQQLCAKLR